MKITYAYDSNGILTENNVKLFYTESSERINEAEILMERIVLFHKHENMIHDRNGFDLMIQPMYTDDTILYFTRTQLSSGSEEVRLSNYIKYKPDFVFSDIRQEDMLRSIFPYEINGKTTWWLLTAEMLAFERNLYDGEYIKIKRTTAIPYNRLIRILSKAVINDSDMNSGSFSHKYKFFFKRDLYNISDLLKNAAVRDRDFEAKTRYIIDGLKKMYELGECDERSNLKNLCLWHINDRKPYDAFPEYDEIKRYLKDRFHDISGICYKGNAVKYRSETYGRQTVYVCSSMYNQDSRLFITNGHIYHTIDELKKAIEKSECFNAQDWYNEDVVPHIKKPVSEKINKREDVIGWYRKG